MFRRRWSGLPEDPSFPADLKKLGYFINDDDELRSIADPKFYFKYFLSRNTRVNDRQRFAFNTAVQKIIHKRLEAEGLTKVMIPAEEDIKLEEVEVILKLLSIGDDDSSSSDSDISTPPPSRPPRPSVNVDARLPIFASADIASASRVVVIFGELEQELGVLAHRVIGGPGGINKGSMVSVVKALRVQKASKTDSSPPGIILANTGELWWWPEGKRVLSQRLADAVPMRSAVHHGRWADPSVNAVPRNRTVKEHVAYMLSVVIPRLVNKHAKLDVIGLGDGSDVVEEYFNDAGTWAAIGRRLNSLAIVGGFFHRNEIQCAGFRKFLREKSRAWIPSWEPLNHAISGPDGNERTKLFTGYGCPVFSSGEKHLSELLFISSYPVVLDWIQEVALTNDYVNPEMTITFHDEEVEESPGWGGEKTTEKGDVDIISEMEGNQRKPEAEAEAEAEVEKSQHE